MRLGDGRYRHASSARFAAAAAVLLAAMMTPAPARAAATTPVTIPAVQSWSPSTGAYRFTAVTRIVVDQAYAGVLSSTASVFAEDLSPVVGRVPPVLYGPAAGQPGDIFLTLAPTDPGLGAEGYRMTVSTTVTIAGHDDAGVFYGTRTLLQLLAQSRTVPGGTAVDRPAYPERGLMVDTGRKYFTVGWLSAHIKELAYLKLNYLHLHLSDNLGFRLESDTHPEIVSAQHYTKAEIADLVALAARYHVTVVPEIDMPGHMDQILAAHPDLKLTSSTGTVHDGFVDLSKDAAYTLMNDLLTEYLPLFPASYFHLGADEYVTDYANYPQLLDYARAHYGPGATAKDTYYGFINWADGIVRAHGKTMRMWNDGYHWGDGTIAPAADIVVEHWYDVRDALTPQQLVDRGHQVANASFTQTYYVLGNGRRPDMPSMYETWTVNTFQGGLSLTPATAGRNRGASLHVWCDNPGAQNEQQIAGGIRDPLRVLAQQTWNSPKLAGSYAGFQQLVPAVGRVPGWTYDTAPGNLALNRPVTASSVETPDFPAVEATDGSYGSRWSSLYADPQWLRIDLGAVRQVGRVKLTWEFAYGKAYQIQVSTDGVTWTTIYSTTTGDGGTDDLTGLSGSGRYLRVYGTQRGTQFGYSLWEVEVY